MGNSKSSQQRKWPGSQQQHPKRATSVTRRTDPSSSSQQPKLTQSTLSFGPKTDPPAKRFSAGLRVREQTKPQSFSSNDPPRASSSRAELKPLSARATPFPAPPRQHLQAGPSKRKTSSSHLDTQPQKKKLRSTSPSECKQQQQPSSEADYVEGMSQLSQLPFVNHPDRLRDFWVTHKAIFDLDETPAHPPLPRSPEPKPPSPTILDHRLDLSSPTSTSNQNKGPYHAVCQLDADDDATEEECDEPSPSGSRRSPRHPQSPLHKAQSGPDDSGVAFDANDRSVQLKFSPTRATQDYSSGPVSPPVGYVPRESESSGSSPSASGSAFLPPRWSQMFGSPRPSTSSRPPPSRTSSLPEPLLSPSLEHPTQSRSPLRKTASDTSALSTPAKRSDDANRILCKNTPAHLRLARRSPDVSRALPDTFYPGMEETFPASEHHPPTQYDVASPSSPSASTPWHLVQHHAFSTAPPLPEFPDSHVEEQSVASHSPLPLKTVERERSSTPEAVVEETQAVGMPPPPLTTVESVPFPEVEQAFRGALGSTSTADENVTTYSQSRLENFFIARNQPPQEDAALQAIQRHIEHQKHIRSQDFMDASHQLDEDVLPSSQSQPEDITVLNQDQDVIPETQAAFEVI